MKYQGIKESTEKKTIMTDLHYIIVINVVKEKNFSHFTRVNHNGKDEFSVDV